MSTHQPGQRPIPLARPGSESAARGAARDERRSTSSAGARTTTDRLRCTYRARVQATVGAAPTAAAALGLIALHVGSAAAAAMLCDMLLAHSAPVGWLAWPLTAFFIATRFRAIGNMVHEASHGFLCRSKTVNSTLGHLLCAIDFASLQVYRREHLSHHLHQGDPVRDLDFRSRQRFGFGEATDDFIGKHILRPLTLFHLFVYFRPVVLRRDDPLLANIARVGFTVALLVLAHAIGPVNFLLYYAIPYIGFYQVIRYWSDALDHAGIIHVDDEFDRARNHLGTPRLVNWLLMPRHDQYHLTHHLFPAVPVAQQCVVHDILLDDPVYAGRDHRLAAAWTHSATGPARPLRTPGTVSPDDHFAR